MKPVNFDYAAPESVADAIRLLVEARGEAKIIAGGQSLLPLLNMRMARPSLLVDLARIPGLDEVRLSDGWLEIGAMTRHAVVEAHPLVRRHAPLLAAAASFVAHHQVRNRGTIGGSTAHADPAAEEPLALLALDSELIAEGPDGAAKWPIGAFFRGPMTTALADAQVLVKLRVPCRGPSEGWAFREISRRRGDLALAAVAVWLRREDGICRDLRVALGGVADRPVRAKAAEAALRGCAWEPQIVDKTPALLEADIAPGSDVHATADYRRAVARELLVHALNEAWERVGELSPHC
ncbi:MAG: xanthine dehydrogenase family protein subunit M [Betaproteobacteria bacterium]|nr:xanthine dehydrogenase family protein subunit M [Betaproteobacteria bacterium]